MDMPPDVDDLFLFLGVAGSYALLYYLALVLGEQRIVWYTRTVTRLQLTQVAFFLIQVFSAFWLGQFGKEPVVISIMLIATPVFFYSLRSILRNNLVERIAKEKELRQALGHVGFNKPW